MIFHNVLHFVSGFSHVGSNLQTTVSDNFQIGNEEKLHDVYLKIVWIEILGDCQNKRTFPLLEKFTGEVYGNFWNNCYLTF